MKLSDYIAEFLVQQGIKHVFVISGGAILHLIDSVSRHPQLDYICVQHEQGAGQAADAYSRISGNLGAVMVTSGPGATNLTTSICNAYFDSIPVLFICGQVATFRLRPNEHLRQKGFQETDIVAVFASITKYVKRILDPLDIRYELEKAVYLAKSGRPGPVVLDIPDDIQRVEVKPGELRSFHPPESKIPKGLRNSVQQLIPWIKAAERPVLIYGAGVRLADAISAAREFAQFFHLPIFLTWGAKDILPHDDSLNMGGLGVCGPRAGNFALQNADLVIAVGTRLSQMITGGKQNLFAPKARKVMIDVDPRELNKFTAQDFSLDLSIHCDIREFFKEASGGYKEPPDDPWEEWRAQIKAWDRRYPVCPSKKYERTTHVDAHVFVQELSHHIPEGAIVIADTGANVAWTLQAFEVKKNQRIISAWNHTPMGYSIGASIGAALVAPATGHGPVICLIGDGGLMMSLSELATLKRYQLPVKVFIFNNRGHAIQKQMIEIWLKANYAAVDEKTGLNFPDFIKIAEGFGLASCTIENHTQLQEKLPEVLAATGPMVCNVEIDGQQRIEPMLAYGSSLEDLNPKLTKEEIAKIMAESPGSLSRRSLAGQTARGLR